MSEPSELIKARMELIVPLITGVNGVITGAEFKLTAASLPAIEIRPTSGEEDSQSSDESEMTRVFEWWVFAAQIGKVADPASILAALNAALPFADRIRRYLRFTAPRLNYNDQGLNGVVRLGNISDSGPAQSPYYDAQDFGVVRVRVPVIYTISARS